MALSLSLSLTRTLTLTLTLTLTRTLTLTLGQQRGRELAGVLAAVPKRPRRRADRLLSQ